ncbi:MAG: acetamidase/formamidase family protein [Planctomycetes bacterium]|nr:acetamidase/formamidase family protein [Planctomycetota bacterium]
MQTIGKDILYFETGPDNKVTHRVEPGEAFEVVTQINNGPWIDRLPEAEQKTWRERLIGGNPASGCIWVEGAKPGDMLSVEIGAIEVDPVGYTRFGGWNFAMPGWMDIGVQQKLVEIRDGVIHWSEKLKLPVRPMLGFVGVAPARERFSNEWGGAWGGNMDAQEVTTGTTLHLRVNCAGALLHIGDMHALQGDGEICGAGGIEAGGKVQVTCRLTSPAPEKLRWPRFEDATHIGVIAQARPAEDAFRHALCDLLRWLEAAHGIPAGEAYLLLGQVLEARVTAYVNPTYSYVAKIARKYVS